MNAAAAPIRVVQIIGKMVGGGVESVVMNYYRHIDRQQVQFDFFIDEDSTLIPKEEILDLGGSVTMIPPYQRLLPYRRRLRNLLFQGDWRIVHSHINALSVIPLGVAKQAGVSVRIAHSHSTSGAGEPFRNVLKSVLKTAANVYPTDRFACGRLAGEWLFGHDVDFEIVNNAVDLTRFSFDETERLRIRHQLGIPVDAKVVGHIGRFVPQKNHERLLCIFKEYKDSFNGDAILILVGDGELRKNLEQRAVELGIRDSVRFLGQRLDVPSLYCAMDCLLLPSLYEGLVVVGVEAQATGLPCVVSTAVSPDTKLSRHFWQVSLGDPDSAWARVLDQALSAGRSAVDLQRSKLLEYDIRYAAPLLTEKYLSMFDRAMRR